MAIQSLSRCVVVCVGLAALAACGGGRSVKPGSAEALNLALRDSVDNTVIPAVSGFSAKADALVASSNTFCTTSSTGNLDDLQSRWKELSLQWNRIAMYDIGPLNDDVILPTINFIESMRQNGQDYTATVRSNIIAVLGNADVLNQGYFDGLPFTRVGMLALEVLIFETSDTQATGAADIVTDYRNNPRKCEYLQGMAQLMARHADAIEHAWQTEYRDTGKSFRDILIDGEVDDGAEAVPALVSAIQQHLDYLRRRKLDAIPDARIADYFYENMAATLDAIEALLEGRNDQAYSFFRHMNDSGFGSYEILVRDNIATARSAATNQDRSALSSAIGVLDGNFKREVPEGLNVELGINFNDGD